MKAIKEILLYVNNNLVCKRNLQSDMKIKELRNILEEQIPNQLYFLNKGMEDKLLNEEEEETLCVKDIINESNSIYLRQECFKIYIDNVILKKEEVLFKTTPIRNFLQSNENELPESFFIKSKSNLLIDMSKIFIDYNLMIDDILTGNSIYIFSMKNKKAIKSQICKNNSLCCLEKIKGNIIFTNIQFDKIRIFDKFIPDNEFENYVDESNYEKRRRNSLTEYEKYEKINLDEGKIKNLISNNNTNEKAIFDYLNILKKNKNPNFQQELKKYAYLLHIEQLKILDDKFKDKKYFNYKDEKSNLLNFLRKVINGDFEDYNSVSLIISHIDYRDSIQNEIVSPFIGGFNKSIYINIPIPFCDTNLLFHYLRVKFFQYLENAFGNIQDDFKEFCQILYSKIKSLDQIAHNSKQNLLFEIFCMVCIFGLHDNNIDTSQIIKFYDNNHKINERYYHSILFFSCIKNILYEYFIMIANSFCLETALIQYKEKINKNAIKPAELNIKKAIGILLKKTFFLPFFSEENWGLTIPAFNISFINIDIDSFKNGNSYPDVSFLFYFTKYIISFLHEPIGHNFKIYESFEEKLETPFESPRSNDEMPQEGGFLMEILLINSIENLNIEHILYLLNENNWKLNHSIFLQNFKSIKEPVLKNCLSHIKKSKMMNKLFSIFSINKSSIEYAIKNELQLSTLISQKFENELIVHSEEKFRKNKSNKKNNKGRICLTHLYY